MIVSECQGKEVQTPSNGDSPATWLERHIAAVNDAIANGDLVIEGASRIYTCWPVANQTRPRCLVTIRYNGPPPETDSEFLARHFGEVATDMVSYPPVP